MTGPNSTKKLGKNLIFEIKKEQPKKNVLYYLKKIFAFRKS